MKLDGTFLPIGAIAPRARADVVRLGAFQARSFVHGPGARAVVWVTGCLRRCPSCMKPDFFSFDAGWDVSCTDLIERILAIDGLSGVSFSGGEPFEQALALSKVAKVVKQRGLSVLVYSGYRLDALSRGRNRFGPLLEQTDILIDGEYREDLPGPFRWRGSENQVVHQFGQSPNLEWSGAPVREVQVSLTASEVRLSGFPSPEMETELADSLKRRGILLRENG